MFIYFFQISLNDFTSPVSSNCVFPPYQCVCFFFVFMCMYVLVVVFCVVFCSFLNFFFMLLVLFVTNFNSIHVKKRNVGYLKRFYFSSLLLVIVCCGFVISAAIVFKSLFTSFLFLLCYNLTLHKKGRTNQLRFDFWGQVLRDGQEMKTCFALVLFALSFKYLIIVFFLLSFLSLSLITENIFI